MGRARALAGAARVGAYMAPPRGRSLALRTSAWAAHRARRHGTALTICLWSMFARLRLQMSVYTVVGSDLCCFAPTQVSVAAQFLSLRRCAVISVLPGRDAAPVLRSDRGLLKGLARIRNCEPFTLTLTLTLTCAAYPLTVPHVLLCPAPYPLTPRARRGLHPCAPSVPLPARVPYAYLSSYLPFGLCPTSGGSSYKGPLVYIDHCAPPCYSSFSSNASSIGSAPTPPPYVLLPDRPHLVTATYSRVVPTAAYPYLHLPYPAPAHSD
ncbi:hypothetical protein C8F04DRAFT_1253073 [Mycena alexandri]|uniref:Uncharacterized protein n=1 Tax=Mycena alexandri TaxID=1745969 RepID=A0AAD6T8K4_9AGAR|nr:hypothetical protein C8F04DRAFT_1253073 [Mycena alexandri]